MMEESIGEGNYTLDISEVDINNLVDNPLERIIKYMYAMRIFNTYVIAENDGAQLSIILRYNDKKKMLCHLPKFEIIKKNDELIGNPCSICLDNFAHRQTKRALHCSHVFHRQCIDKWLMGNRDNMSCPICRKSCDNTIVADLDG